MKPISTKTVCCRPPRSKQIWTEKRRKLMVDTAIDVASNLKKQDAPGQALNKQAGCVAPTLPSNPATMV